jgi:hypothetical protein
MRIRLWQSTFTEAPDAFMQFMHLFGWTKKDRHEVVVSTENESPYCFGRDLRLAAKCPQSDGHPYAAVNITNGIYWVQGDNGLFALCQSAEIFHPPKDYSFINNLERFTLTELIYETSIHQNNKRMDLRDSILRSKDCPPNAI